MQWFICLGCFGFFEFLSLLSNFDDLLSFIYKDLIFA